MSQARPGMRGRSRGAIDTALAVLIGVAIACGALGLWIGHGWGKSVRADEVAALSKKNGELQGQLTVATTTATANADAVTSLKGMLQAELDRRKAIEQRNQAELAQRAAQIARLERAAANRLDTLTKDAHENADCDALRTVPVCDVVAERLWGSAAARPD